MNYAESFNHLSNELEVLGLEGESLPFVFREMKDWSFTDFILKQRNEVTDEDQVLIQSIFTRLKEKEPAQYILGKAYFRNLELAVDSRVLIPRPETEELVDQILSENDTHLPLSVLDIGTGSGAIALSIKQECPGWQVTASDLSQDALDLAFENATAHQLSISFKRSDVFDEFESGQQYDLIVSNPPYIAYEDEDEVDPNVLHSEPHTALFADEDGYAIYRRILNDAKPFIHDHSKFYFEIGYKQGEKLKELSKQYYPEKRVRVVKDAFSKDRMVVIDNGPD